MARSESTIAPSTLKPDKKSGASTGASSVVSDIMAVGTGDSEKIVTEAIAALHDAIQTVKSALASVPVGSEAYQQLLKLASTLGGTVVNSAQDAANVMQVATQATTTANGLVGSEMQAAVGNLLGNIVGAAGMAASQVASWMGSPAIANAINDLRKDVPESMKQMMSVSEGTLGNLSLALGGAPLPSKSLGQQSL